MEVLSKEIQISVSENDLVKNVLEKCLKQVNLKTEALGVFLHANTSKKLTYLDPNRPLLSYKPQEQVSNTKQTIFLINTQYKQTNNYR